MPKLNMRIVLIALFLFLNALLSASALGQLESNITSIKNGYRYSSWSCYGGYFENHGSADSCKGLSDWVNTGAHSCKGRCVISDKGNQCGLDNLSVSVPCDTICGNDICEEGESENCLSDCHNLVCTKDEDCPIGKCENEKNYDKYSCFAGGCKLINYIQDPCSASCVPILCINPPNPSCNERNLVKFSQNGTCGSFDTCQYGFTNDTCKFGCYNAKCLNISTLTPKILSPVNNSILSGLKVITIPSVESPFGERVELFMDGSFYDSGKLPYQFAWDTAKEKNGTHEILARAYDSFNNSIDISITVFVSNDNIMANLSIDSDHDGVFDRFDLCPNTGNYIVNKYGCPVPFWSKFSAELTTNFSDIDLRNFTGLRVGIRSIGIIDFGNNMLTLLDSSNGYYVPANLDSIISFDDNSVIVNSGMLNVSSIITLTNLTNIKNPLIKVNGASCTYCKIISFKDGILTFSVPHYTEYSVEEGSFCTDNFCSQQESCSSCPQDCGSCQSGGGGSQGTGGGGGGGGSIDYKSGSSIGFECFTKWVCDEWGACANGLQTRKCDFKNTPQYLQKAECPKSSVKPQAERQCEYVPLDKNFDPPKIADSNENNSPVQINPAPKENQDKSLETHSSKILWLIPFGIAAMVLIALAAYKIKSNRKVPNTILSYIKKMRAAGKTENDIKNELMKLGISKETIEYNMSIKK